jgi:antitoxin component YwqK of YwqJK toxin-antitoxin module
MAEVRKTYYESGELESEVFKINDKRNGEIQSLS